MPAFKWLIVDIETIPRDDVADFLEEPAADKRYTDPAKIAADLEAKRAAQLEQCSLDWNAGRICVIGTQTDEDEIPVVRLCQDETDEADALRYLWRVYRDGSRRLVTFNGMGFDVPFLIQRSRYLGVAVPKIDQRKYGNSDQIDLFGLLTFDGTQRTFVVRRTLGNFCRLFGLDVPADDTDGSQIAALVRAGDWDAVAHHVRADVVKTRLLAERLQAITVQRPEVVL